MMFKQVWILIPAFVVAVNGASISKRQTSSAIPGISIPAGCENDCKGLNELGNPNDVPSICTVQAGQLLKACVECGIRITKPTDDVINQAQDSVNTFVEGCTILQKPIPAIIIDKTGGSGSAAPPAASAPASTSNSATPAPPAATTVAPAPAPSVTKVIPVVPTDAIPTPTPSRSASSSTRRGDTTIGLLLGLGAVFIGVL